MKLLSINTAYSNGNILHTGIQLLDDEPSTMLFKHSHCQLGVRYWISHSLTETDGQRVGLRVLNKIKQEERERERFLTACQDFICYLYNHNLVLEFIQEIVKRD